MDQWHSYPSQYTLLEFAFTTWLLPQSALTLPGVLNLVCPINSFLLPLEVLPPSTHLSSYHPTSKASLSFYLSLHLCLFRPQSFTWLNANTPYQHDDKPYHQTHSWLLNHESKPRWRSAVRAKQGMRQSQGHEEQGSCYNLVVPAFTQWWLCFKTTTISNVNTQLELHFLIDIQTSADRRIPGTFFVSFYLKVVIQADLCAGLLFPVHLSGLLQLQLLLLVLSSQTLLLWQQQSQKKRKKSMLIRMVFWNQKD